MTKKEKQQLRYVHSAMKRRCSDPSDPAYPNYGGRGVRVCERWLLSANFIADMGARPSGGMIERIDNNGNYEPNNCRWATRKEQNSNRRNCIYVEFRGQRVTLKEASRQAGLKYRPVHKRIVNGWPVELALSMPIGQTSWALRHATAI